MMRRKLAAMSLDQVADVMAAADSGSATDQAAQAEFLRRQTESQFAADKAVIETSEYTRLNARYMLWSVIVLTLSSIATFLVSIMR
jgi:hypothetical protein